MTDAELLAELQPLAATIADKLRTVPVRLGPGGTDDLISELTIAVALYVGRHVLPAEELELRQPPRPTERQWQVETRWDDGPWRHYGPPWSDLASAQEDFRETVAASATRKQQQTRKYRLVRATTAYATEAAHAPNETEA